MTNLDHESPENLMLLWKTHQGGRNYKQLFPQGGKGTKTAAKDIANYAINKETAIRCRIKGDIQSAQIYEGICDKIYNGLPAFAQW